MTNNFVHFSFLSKCPCQTEVDTNCHSDLIWCSSCESFQHRKCIQKLECMKKYVCPDCQFKKSGLFYNNILSLIPTKLLKVTDQKYNNISFNFIFDFNLDYSKKFKDKNNPFFLIFRCLKFTEKGFEFHWPTRAKLFLNKKLVLDLTLKGYKIKDKPIALIFKKDNSIEGLKRLYVYDSNIIVLEEYIKYNYQLNTFCFQIIEKNKDTPLEIENYAIRLDVIEIFHNPEYLIQNTKVLNSTKELSELLRFNEGESIFTVEEKISLINDILESGLIELPSRGYDCCHMSVFDLRTFLNINRKSNKYQCPYCKRQANDLYIDGKLLELIKIIKKFNLNINQIYINKNYEIRIKDKKAVKIENFINSIKENIILKTKKNIDEFFQEINQIFLKYKRNNKSKYQNQNLNEIDELDFEIKNVPSNNIDKNENNKDLEKMFITKNALYESTTAASDENYLVNNKEIEDKRIGAKFSYLFENIDT